MAYQALYRQWRPATFSMMVGQEAVVKTLRSQVASGRVAHAYLFCGSRGTGKTSAAKIMARAVNCLHPKDGDPCGVCEVCRSLLDETSLDVIEIDAASNNGVDEIRDLREKVKYPPQTGRYKVYIIDEVHMLTGAAFNALLKTLEEPPQHVVFILATTEPQKLPATVLSRCQRFDFGRIPAQLIAGRLKEAVLKAGAEADPEALSLIARAAEGGLRDALSILDMCLGDGERVTEALVRSVLGTADKPFLFAFTDTLVKGDVRQAMRLTDELMRGGREPQVFARDMAYHLRALLLAAACGQEVEGLLETTREDADRYIRQAEACAQTKLLRLLDIFMKVETDIKWASSPRVALEAAVLKACLPLEDSREESLLERVEELERKLQTVTELEKKLASGAFAVPVPAPQTEALQAAPVSRPKTSKAEKIPEPEAKAVPGGLPPQKVWDQTLQTLKKTDISLFSQLSGCAFGGAEGDLYRAVVPQSNPFALQFLSKDARRAAVAEALSQVAGKTLRFEAAAASQQDAAKEHHQSDLVKGLIADFGRDKVQIEEE